MREIFDVFINGWTGYANFLWSEIFFKYDYKPWWENYFYWLILVSLFFLVLEWIRPWRKDQPHFRKDFWLDFFYMFFNFFLFSLIIYNAASSVVVHFFNNTILSLFSFDLQASNPMQYLPHWSILIIGFIVRDFIQWWIHRLLHRVEFLWNFHKVHHSIEQMGFAGHLRYHWMENVVYRFFEYLPLALLGIGLYDFFVIHIFSLAVGHYNHSNLTVRGQITGGVLGFLIGLLAISEIPNLSMIVGVGIISACTIGCAIIIGPFMKYLFNSPEMHIWHHAHDLPKERRYGVNFALSLSVWDYLFGTNYIPHDGRDIKLGFPGVEEFPQTFTEQITYGFGITPTEKQQKQ